MKKLGREGVLARYGILKLSTGTYEITQAADGVEEQHIMHQNLCPMALGLS